MLKLCESADPSARLDVPGSGTKPVCEYVLLRDFKCRFSSPRYTYLPEAELTVMTAGHRVQPLDPAWRVLREADTEITYGIPLEAPKKEVEFLLDADREYRIDTSDLSPQAVCEDILRLMGGPEDCPAD